MQIFVEVEIRSQSAKKGGDIYFVVHKKGSVIRIENDNNIVNAFFPVIITIIYTNANDIYHDG